MSFTSGQLADAQKLTGDAYVDLFKITLTNGSLLYISPGKEYVWQGHTYEWVPCKLDGVDRNAGEEASRPKFQIANPDGLFTALIAQGILDNATLTRQRLLLADLLANTNAPISMSWKVKRIVSVNRTAINLELRNQMDGQFFQLPGRMFIPPEFPQVKLS